MVVVSGSSWTSLLSSSAPGTAKAQVFRELSCTFWREGGGGALHTGFVAPCLTCKPTMSSTFDHLQKTLVETVLVDEETVRPTLLLEAETVHPN